MVRHLRYGAPAPSHEQPRSEGHAAILHSNIAFVARGGVCRDILESERGIAAFSGGEIAAATVQAPANAVDRVAGGPVGEMVGDEGSSGGARVRFLTEGKIRESLLEAVGSTNAGDSIDIAMFYVSDRRVINELLEASRRGVAIRLILDPNRDGHHTVDFQVYEDRSLLKRLVYRLQELSGYCTY